MGFLKPPQVTAEALQNFYKSRMPRVAGISLLSGMASDLIINAGGSQLLRVSWSSMFWWETVWFSMVMLVRRSSIVPYSEKFLLKMSFLGTRNYVVILVHKIHQRKVAYVAFTVWTIREATPCFSPKFTFNPAPKECLFWENSVFLQAFGTPWSPHDVTCLPNDWTGNVKCLRVWVMSVMKDVHIAC